MGGIWVSVSGRIGAGKTTLARALCEQIGAIYVGIGEFIRDRAAEQSVPASRKQLQAFGSTLIAGVGGDSAFMRRVVSGCAEAPRLIVDGVRTQPMREALDEMSPSRCLHVHVELAESLRQDRLRKRGETPDEITRADCDPSEHAVDELAATATLIVSGADLAGSLAAICAALETH